MELIIAILCVGLFILWIRMRTLARTIAGLSQRIQALEADRPAPGPGFAADIRSAPAPVKPRKKDRSPIAPIAPEAPVVSSPTPSVPLKKTRMDTANRAWQRLEKQLSENWTGILGAIVMVVGVAFLGIYAALSMSPFERFLMMIAFSAALLAIFAALRSRPAWMQLALWLRSSSGAIILFACLGAGRIKGLVWIDDPVIALAVLAVGIIINLVFGFAGRTEAFASLHVVLSLCSLGVAPPSIETLIIAGMVVLFGIGLCYRGRWDYHLLITITGFLAYHIFWYITLECSEQLDLLVAERITGIALTGVIGLAACFVHYRRLYANPKLDPLPFASHLINWLYMGVGFFLYSTGSPYNTFIIAAAALAAFGLSRHAKRLGIDWLHTTDALIAEALAVFAISTLDRWGVDTLLIASLAYAEILIFYFMTLRMDAPRLFKSIGLALHGISILCLISISIDSAHPDLSQSVANAAILLIVYAVEIMFHRHPAQRQAFQLDWTLLHRSADITRSGSILGAASGLIALAAAWHLRDIDTGMWVMALAVFPAIVIRQRIQSNGLGIGVLALLAGIHCLSWEHMGSHAALSRYELALNTAPLFLLSLAAVRYSFVADLKKPLPGFGIYLFTTHLVIASFFFFNMVSPFIAGVFWLLASVLYCELALALHRHAAQTATSSAAARPLLYMGYALLLLFVLRHTLVHIQSELYIGFIQIRLLIELFGLLAMLYWAISQLGARSETLAIHPLMWELLLVFGMCTIVLEVPSTLYPAVWSLFAIILLVAGIYRTPLSRLRLYSVFLYWASAFYLALIAGSYVTPSERLLDQAWIGGTLSLAQLFVYIIVYYRHGRLQSVEFPFSGKRLARLMTRIINKQNYWIYYPIFIAVAIFLYWSFDSSILTLLWVVEAFAIFVLSLILRENHFRYLSMIAILGCLLRLVFVDLAQSATITRAIVFMSVGIIMLIMNTLYNKYRERV